MTSEPWVHLNGGVGEHKVRPYGENISWTITDNSHEVFPRSDKKLGRVYLIEEWIENYIGELEGRAEAEEAR